MTVGETAAATTTLRTLAWALGQPAISVLVFPGFEPPGRSTQPMPVWAFCDGAVLYLANVLRRPRRNPKIVLSRTHPLAAASARAFASTPANFVPPLQKTIFFPGALRSQKPALPLVSTFRIVLFAQAVQVWVKCVVVQASNVATPPPSGGRSTHFWMSSASCVQKAEVATDSHATL